MNSNLTRIVGKCGLMIKRNLPTILTVASAVGTVAAVVLAIKETRKIDDILTEHNKNIETLKEVHDNPEEYVREGEEYTEQDYKKDLAITYTKTAISLAKVYWPCIVVGTSSIICGFAANGIMRSRNAALATAYTVVSNTLKDYRHRVAEKFGDEVELQIFSGETEEEEVEVITDKKGKEKTVVHKKKKYNPSGYARVFDELNMNWSEHLDNNYFFLKQEQDFANERFKARGFMTLAEVYERLGFEVTAESLCVGWIYDKNGNTEGDNFIDFGYKDTPIHNFDDDIHDHNACIFLDFNVDGPIIDRMPCNNRIGVRN